MEWAIWVIVGLLLLVVLVCPLMMVGGWLLARRGGSHGSHGMMCMGHGSHSDGHRETKGLVEQLKAERQRLDELIAKAERGDRD